MTSFELSEMMLVKRKISTSRGIVIGVIGCGGTGSLFVRDAMRVVSVFNEQQRTAGKPGVIKTFFCDEDIVEDKNLIRQNFITPDIGLNKAEVLAERYGSAFSLDVEVIPRYIEDEGDLYAILAEQTRVSGSYYNRNAPTVILFSMVDNVKTRLMISNYMHGHLSKDSTYRNTLPYDLVVVDCGNSEYSGQVCISATSVSQEQFYLPTVAELQPDLLDPANWDKFASELSCEESAISLPQTIAANATAANIAVNTLYNLLFKNGIDYNKVVFNAQNNCTVTDFIRKSNYKFPIYDGQRIDYNPKVEEKEIEIVEVSMTQPVISETVISEIVFSEPVITFPEVITEVQEENITLEELTMPTGHEEPAVISTIIPAAIAERMQERREMNIIDVPLTPDDLEEELVISMNDMPVYGRMIDREVI